MFQVIFRDAINLNIEQASLGNKIKNHNILLQKLFL